MKTFYSYLKSLFVLIFILSSVNSFAQKDSESPVVKEMTGRKFINDIPRNQTPFTPQPDAPSLIINVPANYPTIQAAINAANNGDIITIDAGIYKENITLNKYLRLRGANYGINPNTGIRGPETIIHPATSDPDPFSPTAITYFYITPGGSSSIIDGITFDGNNPTISTGFTSNGIDIDACEAIGAYDGISNTTVSNNIFKNIYYAAIEYYNFSNGGASTYDNLVTNNKFDNIFSPSYGIGVLIYNNCYTTVSYNVTTRVRVGVQTGNFFNADIGTSHSINNNTIESYRRGIFHNLAYTNATAYIITNNIISTETGAPNNLGISIASIQSAVGVSVSDNNITGARNGYNLWNCPTTNTVTISGGTVTNCKVGVMPNNYDGYSSNADPSVYAMTGITVTNCDTAIWVRDNNLNTNSSTVALNINDTTNIVNGSGIGLVVEGADASVVFSAGDPIDFNTTLSKYIRLITNGSNVPSANINAQDVKFGGIKGSNSTNAQLYAIEDKIDHKIDWNSLGFVSVKAFNDYVTVNSYYPPNTSAPLIQNGIDAATAGDTSNINAGTYNENVTLNKAITLRGSGPSLTILTPSVACSGDGITMITANANVMDLKVTNYTYGIRTAAGTLSLYNVESVSNCQSGLNTSLGTNGLNIVKCKFNNNSVAGWRAGTGDNVSNVVMDSCEAKGNTSAGFGFGITISASTTLSNTFDNITIKNSDFSNNLKKGMYFEKLSNALIDNIIMDNSGTDATYGFNNGIDINLKNGAYTNITIQNSSITNCGSTGTAGDVNNPSALAIKARDDGSYSVNPATLTGFTLKNCFITGPVNGLRFGEFNVTNNSPTGNTVIENNFGGAYSNKAILNKTANPISVSCNWYGTTSNPAVAALNGTGIIYTPFLTNGIDNNLSAPGFQIVPGSCNGPYTKFYVNDNSLTGDVYTTAVGNNSNPGTPSAPFATITYAISSALAGDTIYVDAGTFAENPTVNKSLRILGSNQGTAGSGTRVAEAIVVTNGNQNAVFTITASNVTINGLTLDGDDTGLTGSPVASGDDANALYAIRPTGLINNLVVSNNIIKKVAIGLRGDVGVSTGNVITRNWFDAIGNFDFGYAVSIRNDFYADVTDNKMTRVWTGLHANNHHLAGGPATWIMSGNEVHSYAAGLCYWLQYQNATPMTVTGNRFFAESGAVANNFGMLIVSIQDAMNPSFTNNSVSGTEYGIGLFNVPTSNNITLGSTDTVSGTTKSGIFLTNNLNFNPVGTTNFLAGGPGAASTVKVDGVILSTASGNGLHLDASGGTATTFNFISPTAVNGGVTGFLVNSATAAITGNSINNLSFSGQSGNYVTLTNNALQSLTIDATGTLFDGSTGAGKTLAQNFSTEDKISHKIDNSTLGFILVKTNNDFVTINSFAAPATTAPSVQRAIDVASGGFTVNVANGTYNEDIDINKSVTVDGESTASILRGLYAGSVNSVFISTSNVTLKDVTVTRDFGATLAAWYASTKNQGITVQQNTTGIVIQDVLVTGNRNGIFVNNVQGISITQCTIEDNRTGLHFGNNISNAEVHNNFIRNNFTHGVLFNYDLTSTITATNAHITNNSITGNWYSQVNFQRNAGPVPSGDHTGLSFNCNWYGTPNPSAVAANAAEPGYGVQPPSQFGGTNPGLNRQLYGIEIGLCPYIPWLTNGTDNALDTAGFQPVPGSCNGMPLTSLYINDNSLSGDHYTTAVGNDGNQGTSSSPFATINYAMSIATPGDTLWVDAGTYIEDIIVNKDNVSIRGSNYLINPNTGSRVAESIIMPATDDPEFGVLINLQQSNLTLDGFLFNGDNPALNSGYAVGSADVNTSEGICNGPAVGPYFQIDHINIQNNILNNFDYQAILMWEDFNSNHSWNYIKNNKFNNMWEGVQTYAMHADISYNTFTGVDRALSMHGVHAAADPGFVPQIANNTVSITWKTGYSRNIGIWVNYRDGNAPALEVKNNTIDCSDLSLSGKNFYGFYALTLKDNRVVSFLNNTITGAGNCSRGFYMSACSSTNVTLTGGAFNNIRDYGIYMTNFDPTWLAGDSRLTVDNLPITMSPGATAGVNVFADNSYVNSPGGSDITPKRIGRKDEVVIDKEAIIDPNASPSATNLSALNISNSTITGASAGIAVTGTLASANIHDNPYPSAITGAVIGVDVDGGTTALYRNNITANGTGVRVKNSGNLDSATENYITANTVEGISIESTAGNIGIVSYNDLSGNTGYAIKYLKPTPALNAMCNWYGASDGATVNSKVNGNVNFITWLTNGTDNAPGTAGFQAVPGSCNGVPTKWYVNDNSTSDGLYTTAVGNDANSGTPSAPFLTINHAVSQAQPGDTIYVDAGTYTLTSAVVVNKKLTFFGRQAGADARTRGVVPESIVDAINLTGYPSTDFEFQPVASESKIDGFTVQGANGGQGIAGIWLESGSYGSIVQNNIIQNNLVGLFLANNSASNQTVISQNLFRNNTAAGPSSGHGIYADNYTAGANLQNVLIKDNTFTNTSFVVDSWGMGLGNTGVTAFTNLTIQDNQISNHGRGMYLSGISGSTITGNSFADVTNYAIQMFEDAIANSTLTVTNNIFTNNFRGIWVNKSSPGVDAYSGTLTPTGNTFTGGTYDLINSSPSPTNTEINATGNTYNGVLLDGSTSLANIFTIADKVLDAVDVGTYGKILLKPANVYVTVNSFYVTGGTSTPLIQRGVNIALPTETVNVDSGSYTEQLEIHKALTLSGQGSSLTKIISPNVLLLSYTTSDVNKPVVFVHDTSDVVIKNITVDGAGKGNTNYRFQGIAYRNAGGEVRDCEIKDIRETPINGNQHGVGVYAFADNGNARTLNFSGNTITGFQKNGTVFAGADLSARIDSNTVTGAGPVSYIAQNGIQLSFGAKGSIRNNLISNISYIPSSVVSCGILLYQSSGPDTTGNNTLTATQAGIYYIDVGGVISENTISATAISTGTNTYLGIDADPGDSPRIPAEPYDAKIINTRKNNPSSSPSSLTTSIYRNVLTSDGTNGTGIRMDALGTETLNATATENVVNGWNEGVVFFKDAGATLTGIVNDNDLSGNTIALNNLTGVNQNATCNWFGTTGQLAIASKVSGPVTYVPWLTNGADNNPGISGFQPAPASCNGVPETKLYVNDNSTTGDVFTTAVGNNSNAGTASSPLLTITYAVSVANPNDTIYVDAGTYQEQVNINKSLTITGADSAGPSAAVVKAPLVMSPVTNANGGGFTSVIYAFGPTTTLNISSIGIDGDGRGGAKFSGVYYFEASGSFTNSRIVKVRDATYSGVQSGESFFANHTYDISLNQTVTVSNNVIEDYQKTGILINELNTHGIVTNNIVTGQSIQHVNGQNGIQFGFGSYGTITGNTVTGNQYNGPSPDAASGILLAGVGVSNLSIPTGNITTIGGAGVLSNNLSEDEAALLVDSGGYGYNLNANVIYNANNFANNYIHVSESAPNTIPSGSNVYDKRIDNTSQTNVVYGQIQRSVDDASANNILNVSAHTFTEQVEIHKALTLAGQGSGLTTILSPNTLPLSYTTSGVNKPVIYVHDTSEVIIKDLTVDGAGKGNANNRFQGIAYRNAGGTVRGCEIKDIRNTPIDGVQAGVGIYVFADNGISRTLNFVSSTITGFQKNATVFTGADLSARIDSNTITGAGPVSIIAQNGVQISGGAAGSVRYNSIKNISYVPSTVVSCGILLFGPGGPDTTANNTLTAIQAGIYYIDVSGVISENTISATAVNTGTTSYWGIDADPGSGPRRLTADPHDADVAGTKSKINISNSPSSITTSIYRNVLTSDGTNGTGIEMDALGTETLNASATENKVNGWDAGVVFYKDAGATLNGIANDNDLSGNTYALYDLTGVTQNGTCNWFGTTYPAAVTAKVSGSVTYTPFLTNGTDNAPATSGFQPVPGSCNGPFPKLYVNDNSLTGDIYTTAVGNDANVGSSSAPFRTIAHAILFASIGDSIIVDAGSYTENDSVYKSVTILGAGQGATIVSPMISGPTCGGGSLCPGGSNVMLIGADNVSIKKLTIDGNNPSLTSGVVVAGVDIDARNGIITNHTLGIFNNLKVDSVTVKNIYLRGLYASSGGTFTFSHDSSDNVQGDPGSIAMFNFGGAGVFANNVVSNANDAIASNHSTGSVYYGNSVESSGSGIHTDNNGDAGGIADTIRNNVVSNSDLFGYGIWVFAPYKSVVVKENTITNVDVGLANAGQGVPVTTTFTQNTVDGQNKVNSAGVYQTTSLFGFGSSTVSGIYTNNFIKNNVDGFYVEYEPSNTNNINVNDNTIKGNTNGVTLAPGGTLVNDFTCNWWGSATAGDVSVAVSSSVNYIFYLTNGTDNDLGAAGFQPVPGSCNGQPLNANYGTVDTYSYANSTDGASGAPSQPEFCWKDTTGSTNLVSNAVNKQPGIFTGDLDDGYWKILLPAGKKVRFFGTDYDTLRIGTNGIIAFKIFNPSGGNNNPPASGIPGGTVTNAFYPFWWDQNWGVINSGTTSNRLSYKVVGNQLIVTYDRAPRYAGASGDYVSYQVCIDVSTAPASNSRMLVQFADTSNTRTGSLFASKYNAGINQTHLVGLQNSAATSSIQYRFANSTPTVITAGPLFDTLFTSMAVQFGSDNTQLNQACQSLSLTFRLEAIQLTRKDTVTVMLRSSTLPYPVIESKKVVYDSLTGSATIPYTLAENGSSYYLFVSHRNSISTWSASPVTCTSNALTYDFTTALSQAYSNNMIMVSGKASFFTGDVDSNKFVNGFDVIKIFNDNTDFVTGSYVLTDLDYNGVTDVTDFIYANNNNQLFVQQKNPPGAVAPFEYPSETDNGYASDFASKESKSKGSIKDDTKANTKTPEENVSKEGSKNQNNSIGVDTKRTIHKKSSSNLR